MNTTARAAHVTEYFYIFFHFTFTHPDLPSARMTWLRFGKQKFSSLGFRQEVARTETQDIFWYQNSRNAPVVGFFMTSAAVGGVGTEPAAFQEVTGNTYMFMFKCIT